METLQLVCPVCGLDDLVQKISVLCATDEPGSFTGQQSVEDMDAARSCERQEAARHRNDLYLCNRDCVVFNPVSSRCVPVERILDLLRPEPAAVIASAMP